MQTGQSSGSAQLYKIIVQPFYHFQYVELLQVHLCISIEMDMCTVIGAAFRFECVHIIVILMKCVHLLVTL